MPGVRLLRILVLGLAVGAIACERTDPPPQDPVKNTWSGAQAARPTVTFGDGANATTVSVEVVDTEPKIEKGLMYREHLPPDDGMLFLLPIEMDWKFWMRNTYIPLDIIFIKKDMTVAGVGANAVPRTDDLVSVGVRSVYVVEVNAGWCAAHHVTAGTAVRFAGVVHH